MFDTGAVFSDVSVVEKADILERLYTETVKVEKSLERMIERYVSKSAEEGR